jgi:predicted restriction endonuclease
MIRLMLTEETLSACRDGRRRWLLKIKHHPMLKICNFPGALDVGEYYGRPELLTAPSESAPQSPDEENEQAIANRKAEVKQRVKQSKFRRKVLTNFGGRCCLTGITEPELLVASHIVPWAARVDSRLETGNGLCLSALYDRLFDEGFITFGDDLRVIITPQVESLSGPLKAAISAIAGKQAAYPAKPIRPEYLAYHREHVFRKGA